MRETQQANLKVRSGSIAYVDLTPQTSAIRRQQHDLARRAQLDSQSHGSEPQRFVRIMRQA
jgi:predicted RNA-binding protein Jag